ncbi:NACHT domain-containing protein [Acinetobacter modestus]|uniref:ATP-binding protein n=1 Tax=Acinetobacter modestus TaxID=1776740 RepID=A0ABN0JNA8_9GAMM|nr:hypothetical protein [Acinetobacter modestus]ENU26821.1 hypothetical protein F992_02371 [Acinetobacter modestus]GGA11698.1 hypothetical protein GCM10017554_04460 [Acinetobacter modestus]
MIKRTFWYQDSDNHITLTQDELLTKTNPLVIVGEAGMGKSSLLEWLGNLENYAYCTARQLLNRANPQTLLGSNSILVIDALDEISSRNDGDSVDKVLQKLEILGYPKFILACRVADWRSATSLETIREQYSEEPLELHLESFTQEDMSEFLGLMFNNQQTQEIIDHFTIRGLSDLLSNPQTLNLIATVAKKEKLPETLTKLFEQAIELLRIEHSEFKAKSQLPSEIALDAAGAAFASLILTGNEAISRKAIANIIDGELPISEVKLLPDTEEIELILGSRLFRSNGIERFSYLHRRIGEFLGAKWLIKQANTDRKRKRLLSFFHSYEFVPTNLRGLHSWLMNDPALTSEIIKKDPIGILEYGDVDNLTIDQAKILLDSIYLLAENNPRFYNFHNKDTYYIRAFTTPTLLSLIQNIIGQPKTPFSFRVFLVDVIKKNQLPNDFIELLKQLVNDPNIEFAIRKSAGEALAIQKQVIDWHNIYLYLSKLGDESSIRLAIELLEDTGYDKAHDELIANLAISHLEMSDHIVGPLWYLQQNLPKEQIENVLNFFVSRIEMMAISSDSEIKNEAKNFACHLILRFLENYDISAEKLLNWLEPFHNTFGYHDEYIKKLAEFFRKNQSLRLAIQYLVLLKRPGEKNIWQKNHLLYYCSTGLSITSEDIISLLKGLHKEDRNDCRWKELVQLTHHDNGIGKDVREAALPFTVNDQNARDWLDQIGIRKLADWEIQDIERKKQNEEKKLASRSEQRLFYLQNIERLRQGEYGVILKPAKVYLKLFSDISKETPAHLRIADWIGDDISEICMDGFEAFLMLDPPQTTAQDIANILPQRKFYEASYILIVALAERIRKDIGLTDLSNERLLAGYYTLLHIRYDTHAGIPNIFENIENEIQQRGILLEALETFYEPQFQARCEHIDGLARIMRMAETTDISIELAKKWLKNYPGMPINIETELLDCLVQTGQFDAIRELILTRKIVANKEQQLNWVAINLIVDFDHTMEELKSQSIDPNLIWNLRDRIGGKYRKNKSYVALNIKLFKWIISTFRKLYPNVAHPIGVSGGDRNAWDASEFIISIIQQLAKNHSDQACDALQKLKDSSPDDYTDVIKTMLFEQKQMRAESFYSVPTLQSIKAMINDQLPQTIIDLQAFVLEELDIVQAKVKSDDAESWRGFFNDQGKPFYEERCRDHLIGLLRQGDNTITYEPEAHVANDKEVDITCAVGNLRLPIEIKGQWHPDLWTGADQQLDKLYTTDWRAEGRGIYLVLWFGKREDNKKLRSFGRGKPVPNTSKELQEMLIANNRSAQDGKVKIVVMEINKM